MIRNKPGAVTKFSRDVQLRGPALGALKHVVQTGMHKDGMVRLRNDNEIPCQEFDAH